MARQVTLIKKGGGRIHSDNDSKPNGKDEQFGLQQGFHLFRPWLLLGRCPLTGPIPNGMFQVERYHTKDGRGCKVQTLQPGKERIVVVVTAVLMRRFNKRKQVLAVVETERCKVVVAQPKLAKSSLEFRSIEAVNQHSDNLMAASNRPRILQEKK
jgi:hypothetical protein